MHSRSLIVSERTAPDSRPSSMRVLRSFHRILQLSSTRSAETRPTTSLRSIAAANPGHCRSVVAPPSLAFAAASGSGETSPPKVAPRSHDSSATKGPPRGVAAKRSVGFLAVLRFFFAGDAAAACAFFALKARKTDMGTSSSSSLASCATDSWATDVALNGAAPAGRVRDGAAPAGSVPGDAGGATSDSIICCASLCACRCGTKSRSVATSAANLCSVTSYEAASRETWARLCASSTMTTASSKTWSRPPARRTMGSTSCWYVIKIKAAPSWIWSWAI
mmetsp:Transcript_11334/g.37855  ORF Transcript_11334/g.37855 Transcript_11334/m.37855 type:complete len:278 (+) Transcript_11334:841-1674(+)